MKNLLAVSALLVSGLASAVEIPTGGTPVRLDVTSTSIAAWHLENANGTACDDNFGAGSERLNLNGSFNSWVGGLRLDGSGFYPSPTATTDPLATLRCGSAELSNRYRNNVTPEKLWLGWSNRNFEITLGDSYVSFGRGMTLSLRKTDELGTDTTQRGVRAKFNADRFSATLLGGVANMNNLDEASGRYEEDTNDGIVGASADVRVYENIRVGGNATAFIFQLPVSSNPNFPNSLAPGDPRYQERWFMAGPKIDAPRLTNWLSVYLEGVAQRRPDVDGNTVHGFGMYGSATVNKGPFTLLAEGKAYGDLAVVQPRYKDAAAGAALPYDRLRSEFDAVQYVALPTLERVSQQLKHPQQDIYGGRLRLDYTINPSLSVFVNHGLFRDAAEGAVYVDPVTKRETPEIINDPYVGLDARIGAQRIHAQAGYRIATLKGETMLGDGHLDFDVVRAFEGGHTLEFHLVHLERSDSTGFERLDWREGTLQLGYRMRPLFAVSGILDYTTQNLRQSGTWYPGGTVEYDFTESSNFKLFAGSMRGGLKCISGVCKEFAPFSGVKGTLTIRY